MESKIEQIENGITPVIQNKNIKSIIQPYKDNIPTHFVIEIQEHNGNKTIIEKIEYIWNNV